MFESIELLLLKILFWVIIKYLECNDLYFVKFYLSGIESGVSVVRRLDERKFVFFVILNIIFVVILSFNSFVFLFLILGNVFVDCKDFGNNGVVNFLLFVFSCVVFIIKFFVILIEFVGL